MKHTATSVSPPGAFVLRVRFGLDLSQILRKHADADFLRACSTEIDNRHRQIGRGSISARLRGMNALVMWFGLLLIVFAGACTVEGEVDLFQLQGASETIEVQSTALEQATDRAEQLEVLRATVDALPSPRTTTPTAFPSPMTSPVPTGVPSPTPSPIPTVVPSLTSSPSPTAVSLPATSPVPTRSAVMVTVTPLPITVPQPAPTSTELPLPTPTPQQQLPTATPTPQQQLPTATPVGVITIEIGETPRGSEDQHISLVSSRVISEGTPGALVAEIDWGDGLGGEFAIVIEESGLIVGSHNYGASSAGVYVVRITVRSEFAGSATADLSVIVTP